MTQHLDRDTARVEVRVKNGFYARMRPD